MVKLRKGQRTTRGARRAWAGLAALAVLALSTPLLSPRAGADDQNADFRLIGRVPVNTLGNGLPANGSLLIDPVHRRAYAIEALFEKTRTLFHRYDLDATDQGTISTIAGDTDVNGPRAVAADAAGNVYVADTANNRVRKVAPDGTISTFAGTGTAGFSGDGGDAAAAELSAPGGVAVAPSGNVFIADTANNRVRKVSPEGTISTIAGTGTAGYDGEGTATAQQINGPQGVAVDASSNLFLADTANNRVRKVTSAGVISTIAGTGATTVLDSPAAVAADTSVTPVAIYIADTANNRVRKVGASGGTITTVAGTGTAGFSGDGGLATAAQLNAPRGVAVNTMGNLYIADSGNQRVRLRLNTFKITTVAGNGAAGGAGDGSLGTSASLDGPLGIGISREGDLFVPEGAGSRIRKVRSWEILPPVTALEQDIGPTASVAASSNEYVAGIDPAGSRIFVWVSGVMSEISTASPDPEHPAIHTWVAGTSGQAGANDTVAGSLLMNQVFPHGISYDPGGKGPSGLDHAQSVFVVADIGSTKGVALMGWDARPGQGTGGQANPEARLKWVYHPHSCTSAPAGNVQVPVVRSGDYLYTFCDVTSDGSIVGVLRLKLTEGPDGTIQPDPRSEEIFPGAAGTVGAAADSASARMYFTISNRDSMNALVFDGTANEGRGAYTGEVALESVSDPQTSGLDPVTGRWYFQTVRGLWYENGRLGRIAQAVRSETAPDAIPGDGQETVPVNGYTTWQRMRIDPAVVENGVVTRGARLWVYRPPNANRCPLPDKGCYEVFEDTKPLPGTPPPPEESTLNTPEGPGTVGVYDGVASAYGLRMRVMRGFSTAWQGSVPGVGPILETPPEQNPPANNFFPTDPFFYFGGECGRNTRELTFGRVRQSKLHGDESGKDASVVALAVDPDVPKEGADDDTQTRKDVAAPEACTIAMLRVMEGPVDNNDGDTKVDEDPNDDLDNDDDGQVDEDGPDDNQSNDFWDGVGQVTGPLEEQSPVKEWPYKTIDCQGDGAKDSDGSVQGLAPSTVHVGCEATAENATSGANVSTQLNPGAGFITVQGSDASTQIIRHPGEGIETISKATVKGIDIGGVIGIDEMNVSATSVAKGYATDAGSSAHVETKREFIGLSIAGQRQCAVCDPKEVVNAINSFIGPIGYARAAAPESDWAGGTVRGTKAVVQKNLPLQDADRVTNDDGSTEWPGLEIVLYRDGATRGRGRWELQFGGVFSQAQFATVEKLESDPEPTATPAPLPSSTPPPAVDPGTPAKPGTPSRFIPGTAGAGTPGSPGSQTVIPGDDTEAAADLGASAPASSDASGGAIQQIVRGIERTLKGALLLVVLWALVYAPVYVARRRQFLREVINQS